MPELPEVETTRRGLLQCVNATRIVAVQVRRYDLRTPIPRHLAATLSGRTITDVRRRAKYLLIDVEKEKKTGVLLVHLGMSGSFIVVNAANYTPKTHDHVLITLQNGQIMVFHDPRRFGRIDWLNVGEEKTHALFANLGPEPFSEAFDAPYLAEALRRRTGPIKPVLMDQKLVVGVGNIYASESLYLSGIKPQKPAHECAQQSAVIIDAIRTTLSAAIASGGSTLRDYVGVQNEGGYFQHYFSVYGRGGMACDRCDETIQSSVQAGRTTYWCAKCQC